MPRRRGRPILVLSGDRVTSATWPACHLRRVGRLVILSEAKDLLGKLVYFEETGSIEDAIAREKQLKGWLRGRKLALIESLNPEWEDLAEGWFGEEDPSLRSG